jgi:hypothetical protein
MATIKSINQSMWSQNANKLNDREMLKLEKENNKKNPKGEGG